MKTFELSSGDHIPAIGYGSWQVSEQVAYDCVKQALRCGYTHIDCAAIYHNEKMIGQAFADFFNNQHGKREDLWITSKLWNSYHAPEEVAPALKRTLSDLQLDYLDLYLIHWPAAFQTSIGLHSPTSGDGFVSLQQLPLEDTWQAMEALVVEGLVKNIGFSNFSPSKIQTILDCATIPPVINQVERHPHFPQNDLRQFCSEHQIHMTAYSSLGSGIQPTTLVEQNEPRLLDHPVIHEIAQQYQSGPAQILLAWQLSRGVSALARSENLDHIANNLQAVQLNLSAEAIEKINGLDKNCRYITGSFCWGPEESPYDGDTFWV